MLDFRISSINSALRKVLIRFHYPLEVMLTCVRWYVAYPLSLRHVEEMMQERGGFVDHIMLHSTHYAADTPTPSRTACRRHS